MSRTREEIKALMTTSFIANETISDRYNLDSSKTFEQQFSKVSIENLLFDIVAFAIWLLENIFSTHKSEVDTALLELKPGTSRWYRKKALDFQYGFSLLEDSDRFDNQANSDEKIQNSKIIKYAAVTESLKESRLVVKIATEEANVLTPISEEKYESFKAYINEIKYAGVPITIINYEPDLLKLSIRIFRDPLVLDEKGVSILTGKYPVQEAIAQYMKELPFNGELVLQDLANRLEKTEGVKIVQIDSAESKWIDPSLAGYGNYTSIDVRRLPVSGYFKVENFEGIRYVV